MLNVPAMLIVALDHDPADHRHQESATFNNVIVVIKLTVVLLFIGFGLAYVNRENWEPFIPPRGRARASTAGTASSGARA